MKRFRNENGKLAMPINEINKITYEEARKYFTVGSIFMDMSDGQKYVLCPTQGETADFCTATGKTLIIPLESLGSFLPDVASDGMELIKINDDEPKIKTVKVTFEDGNTIISNINGTIEEVKDYYLGKVFNIGSVTDNLQTATNVEIIEG